MRRKSIMAVLVGKWGQVFRFSVRPGYGLFGADRRL